MRVHNEYLTSNTTTAYPFVDGASGLAYDVTQVPTKLPLDVIVDALFESNADTTIADTQLFLSGFRRISATQGQFLVKDAADNQLVLTATVSADIYTKCRAIRIDPLCVGQLVVLNEGLSRYLALLADDETITFEQTLPFIGGVQGIHNPKLLTLSIYNNGPDEPADYTGITEDVKLLSGYNIDITQATGVDGDPEIAIAASPGAGRGQLPCDEEEEVTPSNVPDGLVPVEGNIQIAPGDEGCYVIVPTLSAETIQIQGKCQACCTCDDYADMLDLLHGMADRVRALKEMLDDARALYEQGVTHFNRNIAAGEAGVTIALNGMRGPETRAPNVARWVGTIRNRYSVPVTVTGWGMYYASPTHSPTTVDITWEYQSASEKTAYGGPLPVIEPFTSIAITILINVDMMMWLAHPNWIATFSVDVQKDGSVDIEHLQVTATIA